MDNKSSIDIDSQIDFIMELLINRLNETVRIIPRLDVKGSSLVGYTL